MKSAWLSGLCVLSLFFTLSCTKGIIEQDAVISPEGTSGDTLPAGQSGAHAGDASESSQELKTIYFSFDSYTLRADAVKALQANANWLHNNPSRSVQVEGHCDERGTVEYNLALGERRAEAARTYLLKSGIEENRVLLISYGKERPDDSNHNERAWAKNRRDVFVVLPQ